MCWHSYKRPVRKTADKDITCWKVVYLVNTYFKSVYFGKLYKIHKRYFIYDDEIYVHKVFAYSFFTPTTRYYINKGFHSYNNKVFIKEAGLQRIVMNENKKMWHDRFYGMSNLHVIKCIIPEGSIYYENEDGELVSSSIKIIGLDED